jgi:hypothetical protein
MANPDDDGKLSATELSQAALATVQELTGYQPEAVIGLEWDGDLWQVRVDVLELKRVPNTTDMIGEYLVSLDEDGTLRGYKRISRFQRGKPMEEG